MSGYFSARDRGRKLVLETDVVIVGSGAGGAVVAAELAEAGREVLVLEEGPRIAPEAYGAMRPAEAIRHAWRDGATTVALGLGNSPSINVTMGRCVGGSSVLTGGVCFRIPEMVHREWVEERGLTSLTARDLSPCFEHVESRIHVEEVPQSMWSNSTRLFAEGAQKCGWPVKPLRRNTNGCRGCGRCNFGCPHQAKRSVDLSYLPQAVDKGACVWSHCLIERLVLKRGRAVGVKGRLLDGKYGRRGSRLEVRANTVIMAAGAWHTPLILKRSGVGGRLVGRNLTLHPAFKVLARFDEPVEGWRGALQAAYVDHFEAAGITLVGLFIPPALVGASTPGIGPEHRKHASMAPNLALFGGIIHDQGGGTIHRSIDREPVVTYRMAARDRARFPTMVRNMAQTFFAAGAREVFLPIFGMGAVDADGLAGVDLEHLAMSRVECTSQHPLGSCQMGTSPSNSVVDSRGAVWGIDQLYLADGSIVPTSLGVNPQLTVMAMATRVAWGVRDQS
jgi:choline dehydrogenase-like flavoprotein